MRAAQMEGIQGSLTLDCSVARKLRGRSWKVHATLLTIELHKTFDDDILRSIGLCHSKDRCQTNEPGKARQAHAAGHGSPPLR